MAWITLPRSEGVASRQAHTDIPEGCYEREMGREGFFGPATQIYHRHPPTGWSKFEGPLRPRAFDTNLLNHSGNDPWLAPHILGNSHTNIRLWHMDGDMSDLARNADGDELLFIHKGEGELFCDYGHLSITEGDYILIPRGTQWRIECGVSEIIILMIEAHNEAFTLPDKGLVGQHAIFDPAVLDVPKIDDAFKAQQDENPWKVVVKRNNQLSTIHYPFNPLDAVGWHGTLMVLRVNWRDIRPMMSHRYHLPPSAHATFVAPRLVVCTFCPRPVESDPGALKVPFFHSNDDYDEVIFYHQGKFFSRDNIHPGMITFHPCGFPHGPHPKALAAATAEADPDKKPELKIINEVAVMIDTRDPLEVSPLPDGVEWLEYPDSWKSGEDK